MFQSAVFISLMFLILLSSWILFFAHRKIIIFYAKKYNIGVSLAKLGTYGFLSAWLPLPSPVVFQVVQDKLGWLCHLGSTSDCATGSFLFSYGGSSFWGLATHLYSMQKYRYDYDRLNPAFYVERHTPFESYFWFRR